MNKKNNNDKRRDMVVGKVVAHLCLTLIIILKFMGMFRLGVGAKANMSHVACKWAPKAINKKVT